MDFSKILDFVSDFSTNEITNLKTISYPVHSMLIEKGESSEDVYIILDGFCDVLREMSNGSMMVTDKLTVGDVIGLREVLFPPMRRVASVRAHTKVKALKLTKNEFYFFHSKYSSFSLYILKRMHSRLHNALSLSLNSTIDTSDANIRYYLCSRYRFFSNSYPPGYTHYIKIDIPRQEMADFLGLEVRTLNQYLKKYKDKNKISIIKGKIHIDENQYESLVDM